MFIRRYRHDDEKGWLRCRILSFLDTAYFDHVVKQKEKYGNNAIELVAVNDDQIVGLIDIELEDEEKTVCTAGKGIGGMIWHIAVHPDCQKKGIGKKLLIEAEKVAKEIGLNYLEAWTRDDKWVNRWYINNGFFNQSSYLQVFMEGKELVNLNSEFSNLYPVQAWAHYLGNDKGKVKDQFKRVHECFCYTKTL